MEHHPSCPQRQDAAAACIGCGTRSGDTMLLDVLAHAAQAMRDFTSKRRAA